MHTQSYVQWGRRSCSVNNQTASVRTSRDLYSGWIGGALTSSPGAGPGFACVFSFICFLN